MVKYKVRKMDESGRKDQAKLEFTYERPDGRWERTIIGLTGFKKVHVARTDRDTGQYK